MAQERQRVNGFGHPCWFRCQARNSSPVSTQLYTLCHLWKRGLRLHHKHQPFRGGGEAAQQLRVSVCAMAQEHERFDSERKGLLRNRLSAWSNQQNGDIRARSPLRHVRPSQNDAMYVLPKTSPKRALRGCHHDEQPGAARLYARAAHGASCRVCQRPQAVNIEVADTLHA